jgi:hypothetical protein
LKKRVITGHWQAASDQAAVNNLKYRLAQPESSADLAKSAKPEPWVQPWKSRKSCYAGGLWTS